MMMLAVVVGYPRDAHQFFDLMRVANKDQSLETFLNAGGNTGILPRVILRYADKLILEIEIEIFQKNLDLVSRFSFRPKAVFG